ncbi:MAG: orotate phosphoribosyltransferase [Burkholderiales bacterium]|nr:orotate phosphoribosyltransferase [Burkholderiales bacterium]
MADFRTDFIRFAINENVLCFGEFTTKAKRQSPYFFNTGLFNHGASLGQLGHFYAEAALASNVPFDMVFGPAYKGIPLATATAISLAAKGRNVPYCFNRKEAKDHGEGGTMVGAPLKGRVLIIDDVITDGASKRESVEWIRAAGAEPAGVLIAFDRQERGQGERSAIAEFEADYGIPVIAIANLANLVEFLQHEPSLEQNLHAVQRYRSQYGVA